MQACPLLQPHFPAIIRLVATLTIQIQIQINLDKKKTQRDQSDDN